MAKLSDAQITALKDLHEFNAFQAGTRKTTVQALVKAEMVFESVPFLNGTDSGVYELTDAGRKAIGVEDIAPGETVEVTGSYAGGHSQEQILELLGEEVQESDEAPTIPFFNRKALRDLRRHQARYNRRMMREQGKRRRKYGADDPKYFRRRYLRLLADTSELAAA